MITQANADSTSIYRSALEPNGWTIGEYDAIITGAKDGGGIGTGKVSSSMPWLRDGSTIWVVPDNLGDVSNITISNSGSPWHVNNVKFRVLPTSQLVVKHSHLSSYAAVRLFGPSSLDTDLRCVQFPADDLTDDSQFAMLVNSDGVLKSMSIMIDVEGKNAEIKAAGFGAGGGSFASLRVCERPLIRHVSGYLKNIRLSNSKSELVYIGSIKQDHAKFVNFEFSNWHLVNAGTDSWQILNVGEGSVVQDISMIRSAVEWPAPFQNYQSGTCMIKAGGGDVKIRRIYAIGYGTTGIGIYSSGDYTNTTTGETLDGVQPGDTIEISDVFFKHGNGTLLQVNNSCKHGAVWIFDNIYVGGAHKRVSIDTEDKPPYAVLADVFDATDKIIFKNITTDNSLPLVGKYGKYEIQNHIIVDDIPEPKFQNAEFANDQFVLAYYHTYNQASNKPFYPTAGKPVKYRKDDVVYYDISGQPRRWFRSLKDQSGAPGAPGEGWKEIPYPSSNFKQSQDSPLLNKAGFVQKVVVSVVDQVKREMAELISKFVIAANEIMNKLK